MGGTSAVAPLWAALITLINQQRAASGQANVGFANPSLYADPSALRDITSGNNGAYKAGTGWDACTGLGSPNGASVVAALSVASASGGSGTPGDPGSGTQPAPTKGKKHKKDKKYKK